jgi:hypothetical protein
MNVDPATKVRYSTAIVSREFQTKELQVNEDTLKGSLQKQGVSIYIKVKKPLLSKRHRKYCFAFAK